MSRRSSRRCATRWSGRGSASRWRVTGARRSSGSRAEAPDLVILDLMLPAVSGLDVCRRIRESSTVPIVMVTAKDSEADKVAGLELGADDYVTKPFSVRELVSRVRAHLRRSQMAAAVPTGEVLTGARSGWTRPPRGARATASRSRFPPKEFELLETFLRRQGRLLTRELLIKRIWGRRLRRGHQDPRRAREADPPKDRAGPARARAPAHGARPRLQVRELTERRMHAAGPSPVSSPRPMPRERLLTRCRSR